MGDLALDLRLVNWRECEEHLLAAGMGFDPTRVDVLPLRLSAYRPSWGVVFGAAGEHFTKNLGSWGHLIHLVAAKAFLQLVVGYSH